MASEIAVVQQQVSPLVILQQAVDKGASIEQLTALMGLAERYEANQAKNAFNASFSAFKSESIRIAKNITVNDGPLKNKKYADLFGIVSVVTPILSKHDLSHSWKLTKDEPGWMEVTCTIKHALGHSEAVSMGAAPDTGPGRNTIQARGSAKTYLERYTLMAAIGMAASDQDDDGNGGMASYDNVLNDIKTAKTLPELKSMFGAAYKMAAKRPEDQQTFKTAYEYRKYELEHA